MAYTDVTVPAGGAKISIENGKLNVPNNPIIPFVEGDGTGRDIWRASVRVFDAAVEKAYGGTRKIHWMEVYAGEKPFKMFQSWLPDETVEAFKEFLVGIKGPVDHPHRRRHPFVECCATQIIGLVCLSAPCALLQRRPFACEAS